MRIHSSRIHAYTLVALVASMLMHGVGAATASLEVSSAAIGPGSSGDFVPLYFGIEQSLDGSEASPFDISMDAMQVRVEIDHALGANPAAIDFIVPNNTTRENHTTAMVDGVENRAGYRFMLIPGPDTRLHMLSTCATISPSETEQVHRTPRAANNNIRPPVEVIVSDSFQWQGCGHSKLTFTGDFTVVLWEWDFQVKDASGSTEYTTGHFQNEATTGLPNEAGAVGERREAWLFVSEGRLELELAPDSPHLLYAGASAKVHTETGVLFQDARGLLVADSTREELVGQDVFLQGLLDVELQRSGQGFAAVIGGDLRGWSIEDQDLALVTPIPSKVFQGETAWILASLGIVFLAGFALLWPVRVYQQAVQSRAYAGDQPAKGLLQKYRAGQTLLAQRALEQGHLRKAQKLAKRAKPNNPAYADALAIQGAVLLKEAEHAAETSRQPLLMQAAQLLHDSMAITRSRHRAVQSLCLTADLHWLRGDYNGIAQAILGGLEQDPRATNDHIKTRPYSDAINRFQQPAGDAQYA